MSKYLNCFTGDVIDDIMNPSVVKSFILEMPDKALRMGIKVVLAIIVFFIGTQIIKLIRKIVKKSMKKAGAEVGAVQFVDSFIKAALYIVLILGLIPSFGGDTASIVALLGSAGVAIGLAIQGSLSNFAGGVLILILKPFRVGDYIQESSTGKEGIVKEIQIFYTKLVTVDNKTVILPNGALANSSLVNITAQKIRRLDIQVGISYKANILDAKGTLLEVVKTDDAVLQTEEMLVFVDELGASSVILGVRCWVNQTDFWSAKWRITENCKLALDRAEIEIPYSQVDVHVRND